MALGRPTIRRTPVCSHHRAQPGRRRHAACSYGASCSPNPNVWQIPPAGMIAQSADMESYVVCLTSEVVRAKSNGPSGGEHAGAIRDVPKG